MRKMKRALHAGLNGWIDRTTTPDTPGEPIYNIFYNMVGELSTLFEDGDLEPAVSLLTPNQRRAGAMIWFATALPCDGLHIGVLVNQPYILPHVREAARALKLKDVELVIRAIDTIVPPEVLTMADCEQRYAWYEEHQDVLEKLDALEAKDSFNDALNTMIQMAMILVADHPDEFFTKQ